MEALAALQLRKKQQKEAEELKRENELKQAKYSSVENLIEQRRLNEMFGFPREVRQVFALSKNYSAAVWWIYDGDLEPITGWEVLRYRKDLGSKPGEPSSFQCKGSHQFGKLERLQVTINELSDNHEYKFSVKAINEKGKGLDSPHSNSILIETPLPSGWFRFYDSKLHRPYYASVKSNRSSWRRPELDPFFIDDGIFLNFQDRELKHLKDLYKEDMAHFQMINVDQFMDILSEIGEKQQKNFIKKLFITFTDDVQITNWQQYMEIMNHLKLQHLNRQPVASCNLLVLLFNRAKIHALLPPKRDKLGENWEIEYNTFAQRYYYRNILTNKCEWSMPDEIKFFLPKALEEKLLTVFDVDEMEEMKQSFSYLDIDNSGDLSENEIHILLKSLGIKMNEKKFKKLMKAIDTNQNGTVEFDEFCWMMYEIKKKEKRKKGLLREVSYLNRSSRSLSSRFTDHSDVYGDSSIKDRFNFSNLQLVINRFGNQNKGKRRLSIASESSADESALFGSVDGKPSFISHLCSCFYKNPVSLRRILADDGSQSGVWNQDENSSHLIRNDSSMKSIYSGDDNSIGGRFRPKFARETSFKSNGDLSENNDFSENTDDYSSFSAKHVRRKSSFRDLFDTPEEDEKAKKKHSKHCYCGCRRF
jgi:Ca2+-binding EF-hand superfamily protein